jgi:hypothetical protein
MAHPPPPAALALAATAVLLLGGCGDDGDAPSGVRTTATTPAVTAPAAQRLDTSTPRGEVQAVAVRYLRALADGDFAVACRTRSRAEQRVLARRGSCADALASGLDPQDIQSFRDVRAGRVRIDGRRARVDILQGGRTSFTLRAVRERGRWALVGGGGA